MTARVHYSRLMSTRHTVRRPGGRTAAVSSAIRTAVEELVAEQGRDKVSIPMVAERAGVNRTTIYRRWPDAAAMINDIMTHYRQPAHAALLRRGAAAAGDAESDCLRGRLDEARLLVDRAGQQAPVTARDVIDGSSPPSCTGSSSCPPR
jgi:AcrR family transcriptional regulator